eukprot:TRINITY_DN4513_c0_g1_i3.p2 TRINITY_DN4513_c0_g1~~TRINITY_DN4513_c0_g1_i3.p2  ORF type:complete len:483 (-),score=190.70 TRINITY_DN4513_c0_g1_i3:1751-3199(-)
MSFLAEDLENKINFNLSFNSNQEAKPLSPIQYQLHGEKGRLNNESNGLDSSFSEDLNNKNSQNHLQNSNNNGNLINNNGISSPSSTVGMENLTKRLVSERKKTKELEQIVKLQNEEIKRLRNELETKSNVKNNSVREGTILLSSSPRSNALAENGELQLCFNCHSKILRGDEITLERESSLNSLMNPSNSILKALELRTPKLNGQDDWSSEEEDELIIVNPLHPPTQNQLLNRKSRSKEGSSILNRDSPVLSEDELKKLLAPRKDSLRESWNLWRETGVAAVLGANREDEIAKSSNVEVLEKIVIELEAELDEKSAKMAILEAQSKRTSLLYWRTMNDKLKLDVDMESIKKKQFNLQQELMYKEQLLYDKEKLIQTITTEMVSKNDLNYKMATKLIDLQTKISNVEIQLRKFPVKKVYRLYSNADVEITLLKNPSNGLLSIDVFESGKHLSRPVKSIQSAKGIENRFYIYYTVISLFHSLFT